jgi:hypothetical protein
MKGHWETWQEAQAQGHQTRQQDNSIKWSYLVPEVNETNFTGLSLAIESQSLREKNIKLNFSSEKALPLEFTVYAFVEGYSKEGQFDTLVQADVPLNLKVGENIITIDSSSFSIPGWWIEERGNPAVKLSLDDIRGLEFNINTESGSAKDTLYIKDIQLID